MFQIYCNLNCKSNYVVYLLGCPKNKVQYVEKAENEFNMGLNNQRKHVYKPDIIPASCNFWDKKHKLNTVAKFTPIKQIRHINKEKNKERLK